ncbi:hypothetical protein PaG_00701 [Moesziomyces aphidis]|uniref:Uncharacterized protein n=1 Tax=Moesziomyces aphidis TaxID=84754 RepID=W3VVG6_MOEAP|nr:hypothetical protein PaG_00701 [Moesziomyces aphidis]
MSRAVSSSRFRKANPNRNTSFCPFVLVQHRKQHCDLPEILQITGCTRDGLSRQAPLGGSVLRSDTVYVLLVVVILRTGAQKLQEQGGKVRDAQIGVADTIAERLLRASATFGRLPGKHDDAVDPLAALPHCRTAAWDRGRPGSASVDADGHAELGGMGKVGSDGQSKFVALLVLTKGSKFGADVPRQVNDSAAERHADLHATDVDSGSDADVARLAATRIDFSSDSELAGGEAEEGKKKNKLLPSWQVSRRCLQLLRRLLRVGSLAGGSASPIDRRVVHAVLACQHWHPAPRNAGLHWQTCWRADGEPSGALPLLACAAAAARALLDRCRLPMHARPRGSVLGTAAARSSS